VHQSLEPWLQINFDGYRALAGCAFDAVPLRRLVNEEDERSEKVEWSGAG